jgi:hypothetical protein
MRKLLVLLVALGALWLAPGALADWCGTGEQTSDRADATTGQQIHGIVVVPADGADNFAVDANRLANDFASITSWWVTQDSTREPRLDSAVFPAGTCDDIGFLRLTDPASAFTDANGAFQRIATQLVAAGLANAYKKYVVYYDGPSVQTNVCGFGGGSFATGPSFAMVFLNGCPGIPTDLVAAHELLHSLGAVPPGAPHGCPNDTFHACDSNLDILYPTTNGTPLPQLFLDINHDDYYGHSGSWTDIQDSAWLHRLDVPQVPLAVNFTGAGDIRTDLPGLDCTVTCTTQWDQGSNVSLIPTAAAGQRFIHWTGGCTGNAVCALSLGQATTVNALFGPTAIAVRVSTAGRGHVACTPACSTHFTAGDALNLRAVPAKGWRFVRWSGGCKGTFARCRPATDFPLSVKATFARLPKKK